MTIARAENIFRSADVIIARGAVRGGGAGNAYLPPRYAAVPTFEVKRRLAKVAVELNVPVHSPSDKPSSGSASK